MVTSFTNLGSSTFGTVLKERGSFARTMFLGKRIHLRTPFSQVNDTFALIRFSQVNGMFVTVQTRQAIISSLSYTSLLAIASPNDTSCLIQAIIISSPIDTTGPATTTVTRSLFFIRFNVFLDPGRSW